MVLDLNDNNIDTIRHSMKWLKEINELDIKPSNILHHKKKSIERVITYLYNNRFEIEKR